jgi:hypothetical protein
VAEKWHLTGLQFAPRDETVKLKRAIVNPADQYKEKGESLHKYGQYIMSCLPKYVQQYVALHLRNTRRLTLLKILCMEG